MQPIEESIEVVWDGDVALVVNKPAGLPTQAPPGVVSLETRLRTQLATRTQYIALPHRLDRPVSGLVLVALRKRIAGLLSAQFASRKVEKVYVAQVIGRADSVECDWMDWLRKVPGQPRAEICSSDSVGAKRAQTRVLARSYDAASDTTTLHLQPHTGRMHQLRLQAARRGHPIVGDLLYQAISPGPKVSEQAISTGQAASEGSASEGSGSVGRIMLHARSLTFHHPRTGVRLSVTAATDTGWGERGLSPDGPAGIS